jgi:uncharacterized protein (DUF1499 family)
MARRGVVGADPDAGTLHATREKRVWRFVNDIRLRFGPTPGGCRMVGRCRLRIGKEDFGQNARRLREYRRALRARAAGPPGQVR